MSPRSHTRSGKVVDALRIKSIRAAVREQKLSSLYSQLTGIVPDISRQYTSFAIDSEYLETKTRAQHSFQVALVNEALELNGSSPKDLVTIADIGDSAGTHLKYIMGLHTDRSIRGLSVNMDAEAIKRIEENGLEAVCARAEDLPSLSIKADIFLSFEMLEHLMDPCGFLKSLAQTDCRAFVMTVPYVARSRVGLHHIRQGQERGVNTENTHIFGSFSN